MMQYLFLQIVSNKWEQKHRVPDTYYLNKCYKSLLRLHWIQHRTGRKHKKAQINNKTSVPKE